MKHPNNIQIGGQHYQSYVVQPYQLMFYLNGAQAHIASHILRTKNPDDLAKAVHWCDLVLADSVWLTWTTSAEVVYTLNHWLQVNNIDDTNPRRKIMQNLIAHNYITVRELIRELPEYIPFGD